MFRRINIDLKSCFILKIETEYIIYRLINFYFHVEININLLT
ncbi:hypothetical protein MGA3_03775 [Bacillus methanolicus MGA3]|nr:hypothetical protein MGA3_03775 [Bacillus methanolicus MGA3]